MLVAGICWRLVPMAVKVRSAWRSMVAEWMMNEVGGIWSGRRALGRN